MSNIKYQINLVTETMLQSLSHMKTALKNQSLSEFLPIYIGLVEGLQSISSHLNNYTNNTITIFKNFEKNVLECATFVEKNDFSQILFIVDKHLEPLLNEFYSSIQPSSAENTERITIIGMYYGIENPLNVYDLKRVEAELKEASVQNCQIIFFESADVNIENETIYARISPNTDERKIVPLPDVIYNIYPNPDWKQDATEQWLRSKVPFTTFTLADKIQLPNQFLKKTHLGSLFIPFIYVDDLNNVFEFFKKHKKGVFKRASSSRGENIFFIEQKNTNLFILYADQKIMSMNKSIFANWVSKLLIPDYYILQQYREFKTRAGNPYDFRAHMQKNNNGDWVLTKLYVRIGSNKGILSNVSQGGYTEELYSFLENEFNEHDAKVYNEKLHTLSFEIVQAIDHIYNFSIHEVGIDLAIDTKGTIYMHEVNPLPQSKYHEAERAIHTIGYAKYLAKNKLFLTNALQ